MAKQAIKAPRRTVFMVDPEEVILIGRDTDDGPDHPRYDVRVLNDFDEHIVQGMMKHGVKKPIVVTKKDGRLEVVDGRQRVINCREANRRLKEAGNMPLRIKVDPPERGSDGALFGLTVMLNEHAIPDTAFGRGQKAQKLFDMGYVEEEVAMYFRVSVGTLHNYTSLLDLIPEIQNMILKKAIPATKGYELARKDEKAQKAFVHRFIHGSRSGKAKRRAPSKKVLRKAVDHGRGKLPSEFVRGLRFALGLIDAGDVEGLEDVLAGKSDEVKEVVEAQADPAKKGATVVMLDNKSIDTPTVEKRIVNGKEVSVSVYQAVEPDDDTVSQWN